MKKTHAAFSIPKVPNPVTLSLDENGFEINGYSEHHMEAYGRECAVATIDNMFQVVRNYQTIIRGLLKDDDRYLLGALNSAEVIEQLFLDCAKKSLGPNDDEKPDKSI